MSGRVVPPFRRPSQKVLEERVVGRIGAPNRLLSSMVPSNSSVPPPAVRLSPDERVADARSRVAVRGRFFFLQVLGEDSVEAQPIKDALKKAREQTRVQLVGERLDYTLKFRGCEPESRICSPNCRGNSPSCRGRHPGPPRFIGRHGSLPVRPENEGRRVRRSCQTLTDSDPDAIDA